MTDHAGWRKVDDRVDLAAREGRCTPCAMDDRPPVQAVVSWSSTNGYTDLLCASCFTHWAQDTSAMVSVRRINHDESWPSHDR